MTNTVLPPERDEPGVRVPVQPAAEPDPVLHAVAQAEPRVAVVHEVDGALDHVGVAGAANTRSDVHQQLGRGDGLRVEDPDDVVAAHEQGVVSCLGLFFVPTGRG